MWPVAILVSICIAAVAVVTVVASAMDSATPTPVSASRVQRAPVRDTDTPQAKALLAEMYRQGVRPDLLNADSAVREAASVCREHAKGKPLYAVSQTLTDTMRQLTPIQAHTFADLSIKYYCQTW